MTVTIDKIGTFTPPNPATLHVEELREWAIDLNVEAHKCHRAGWVDATDPEVPVLQLAHDFLMAAHQGEQPADLGREIDFRYATYLLNTRRPGFEETIALDGDLEHPTNGRGEKVYRPRAVAFVDVEAAA
ncbi:hypothetical protein ACIRF8_15420 [Streptomyces sp. NPDC102406]|uniref:hypothetical protein n=1 Tax=Streptomyces sp. NPDC102406 TaxID=3366171 RepID=UPI003819450F